MLHIPVNYDSRGTPWIPGDSHYQTIIDRVNTPIPEIDQETREEEISEEENLLAKVNKVIQGIHWGPACFEAGLMIVDGIEVVEELELMHLIEVGNISGNISMGNVSFSPLLVVKNFIQLIESLNKIKNSIQNLSTRKAKAKLIRKLEKKASNCLRKSQMDAGELRTNYYEKIFPPLEKIVSMEARRMHHWTKRNMFFKELSDMTPVTRHHDLTSWIFGKLKQAIGRESVYQEKYEKHRDAEEGLREKFPYASEIVQLLREKTWELNYKHYAQKRERETEVEKHTQKIKEYEKKINELLSSSYPQQEKYKRRYAPLIRDLWTTPLCLETVQLCYRLKARQYQKLVNILQTNLGIQQRNDYRSLVFHGANIVIITANHVGSGFGLTTSTSFVIPLFISGTAGLAGLTFAKWLLKEQELAEPQLQRVSVYHINNEEELDELIHNLQTIQSNTV